MHKHPIFCTIARMAQLWLLLQWICVPRSPSWYPLCSFHRNPTQHSWSPCPHHSCWEALAHGAQLQWPYGILASVNNHQVCIHANHSAKPFKKSGTHCSKLLVWHLVTYLSDGLLLAISCIDCCISRSDGTYAGPDLVSGGVGCSSCCCIWCIYMWLHIPQ